MKRIRYRENAEKDGFFKNKKKKKIRFYLRLYEVNPCHPRPKLYVTRVR
jgi:hypothetical protein